MRTDSMDVLLDTYQAGKARNRADVVRAGAYAGMGETRARHMWDPPCVGPPLPLSSPGVNRFIEDIVRDPFKQGMGNPLNGNLPLTIAEPGGRFDCIDPIHVRLQLRLENPLLHARLCDDPLPELPTSGYQPTWGATREEPLMSKVSERDVIRGSRGCGDKPVWGTARDGPIMPRAPEESYSEVLSKRMSSALSEWTVGGVCSAKSSTSFVEVDEEPAWKKTYLELRACEPEVPTVSLPNTTYLDSKASTYEVPDMSVPARTRPRIGTDHDVVAQMRERTFAAVMEHEESKRKRGELTAACSADENKWIASEYEREVEDRFKTHLNITPKPGRLCDRVGLGSVSDPVSTALHSSRAWPDRIPPHAPSLKYDAAELCGAVLEEPAKKTPTWSEQQDTFACLREFESHRYERQKEARLAAQVEAAKRALEETEWAGMVYLLEMKLRLERELEEVNSQLKDAKARRGRGTKR